jgi:hypothetical protein
MNSPEINERSKSRLTRFFSNPTVGVLGSLASIIGVLLAIYFYLEGKEYRDLAYFEYPAKATVVKAKEASSITVLHNNQKIDTDISATQILIWNNGTQNIKTDDFLEPIVLSTRSGSQILEASVRKTSRDVIGLTLDRSKIESGKLGVSWRILEHNDGGVIQIIYASGPEETIDISGTVEGQRIIHKVQSGAQILSPTEQLQKAESEQTESAYKNILWGIIFLYLSYSNRKKPRQVVQPPSNISEQTGRKFKFRLSTAMILALIGFAFISFGVYSLLSRPPVAPFGFG